MQVLPQTTSPAWPYAAMFSMAGGWTGHLPGVGDHVRETHPGADIAEALRLVPDVAFPPVDCADVAEPVARYNARALGA
ncbi:hypothetical protein ACFQ9Q_15890 [Streptomyces virginiae]|uniref:hypothetical protein n=1 Tax=Streptomyces virginiae TaxID=1961 RepID=UPI0036A54371